MAVKLRKKLSNYGTKGTRMNLKAQKGDRVIFLNENGYSRDLEQAIKCKLIPQQTYTVNSVKVGGWISYVELIELPEKWFNTVMFDDERNSDGN